MCENQTIHLQIPDEDRLRQIEAILVKQDLEHSVGEGEISIPIPESILIRFGSSPLRIHMGALLKPDEWSIQ